MEVNQQRETPDIEVNPSAHAMQVAEGYPGTRPAKGEPNQGSRQGTPEPGYGTLVSRDRYEYRHGTPASDRYDSNDRYESRPGSQTRERQGSSNGTPRTEGPARVKTRYPGPGPA